MTKEQKMQLIRNGRNALLLKSDWTQLVDAPLNSEQKQAWRNYRQALRDVPQHIDPVNILEVLVIWPKKPGES